MQGKDFRKRLIIGVFIILAIIGCAYLTENISTALSLKSAKVIKVLDNNKTIAYLDSGVLKIIGSKDPKGPTLTAVLNATGAELFDEITVKGAKNSTIYSINRGQLNDNLVCSLNEDGTADLIDQSSSQILVKSINEIDVK